MRYIFVESTEFTRRIVKMNLEKELRALQTEQDSLTPQQKKELCDRIRPLKAQ
jgi:hypothetical protein